MQDEPECEGKITFGPLPWETSERLAQVSGNWLRYAPEENALIIRHELPSGCPAITGVPCELITFIDSIPKEQRETMPGGEFYVRDRGGRIMRLLVKNGEVRIQWPHEDYSRPVPVSLESVLSDLDPDTARLRGWARFAGSRSKEAELRAFVDRFEGLYPEGDLPSECDQNIAFVQFRNVNVGPQGLLASLKELADPPESLQAELDFGSSLPRSEDRVFRVLIHSGQAQALRPSIWKKD